MTKGIKTATKATKTEPVKVTSTTEAKAQLKVLKDAQKANQTRDEWEVKKKEANEQYVVGSLRRATEEDKKNLHVHGDWVCSIKCAECGTMRTVNRQDAHQVRYCEEHKKEARAASRKKRGKAEELNLTAEEISTQIKSLNEMVASK